MRPPPGVVRLARREREPSDVAAGAADESDESRRVGYGDHLRSDRDPVPGVSPVRPASVVVRRPAPRLGGHPGPSPRVLPDPAAGAIRRPAGLDRGGRPGPAEAGNLLPASVLIEVLDPGDVRRHVSVRARPGDARSAPRPSDPSRRAAATRRRRTAGHRCRRRRAPVRRTAAPGRRRKRRGRGHSAPGAAYFRRRPRRGDSRPGARA